MFTNIVKNSQPFPMQKLKLVKGQPPKTIKGQYFRNGPGKIRYGDNLIDHWFLGTGAILKVLINNGECYAHYKDIDTPLRRWEQQNQNFNRQGIIESTLKKLNKKPWETNQTNPANTSVLLLENSPDLLAIFEKGMPMKMKKQDLKELGFTDCKGGIKIGFAAHPKIDPENGDIINIGFEPPHCSIMKFDKQMNLLNYSPVKLRNLQSIHDFCLAGDYIVIFQYPLDYDQKSLKQKTEVIEVNTYCPQGKTKVHIHKKKDLSVVKQFQIQPFFTLHFTNGYSTADQIVVQHCKYEDEQNIFRVINSVKQFPKFMKGQGVVMPFNSILEDMHISLKDFSYVKKQYPYFAQFAVTDPSLTGKYWKNTYFTLKKKRQDFIFTSLAKFNRETLEIDTVECGQDSAVFQPAYIRTIAGQGEQSEEYVFCIITRGDKSYVQIFKDEKLLPVCQWQLPSTIPYGFHGRWQYEIHNDL